MKIAVNTRFLLKDALEGIGWFKHELLRRIVLNHPEHDFYFFFDRSFDPSFIYADNVTPIVCFPPARHPLLWYYWFEKSLPKQFKSLQPDVFISLDGYLSLSTDVPTITCLHDLAFEHYPKDLRWSHRRYYRHFSPKFARKATKVITVSEFSKQDIVERYKIEEEKVDVIYNGVKQDFVPIDGTAKEHARKIYAQGHRYLIYVGAMHPRKNVSRLLSAYDQFRDIYDEPLKLIVVGRKAWSTKELEEQYEKLTYKDDVHFTGRLSTQQLAEALAGAEALCYVPYFEGFGVPILEAQQAGVPVICSNTSAMPEAAGDSAVLVDPFSVNSIKDGMLKVVINRDKREQLILGGIENAKKFNWDASAQRLWELILEVGT